MSQQYNHVYKSPRNSEAKQSPVQASGEVEINLHMQKRRSVFGDVNPSQFQTVTSGHLELKTPNYEDFAVPHSRESEMPAGTIGAETIGSKAARQLESSPQRGSAELRNYSTLSGAAG